MEDIKLFFSELLIFTIRKLHLSFWRFEKGKGFMVEVLLYKNPRKTVTIIITKKITTRVLERLIFIELIV